MITEVIWEHHTGKLVKSDVIWASEHPFELKIVFFDVETAEWVFARDLLADAIELGSAGDGDIVASRDGKKLFLLLNSPFGSCVLETVVAQLEEFIDRTYVHVPREQEYMNMDEELDKLLGRE